VGNERNDLKNINIKIFSRDIGNIFLKRKELEDL